MKFLKLITFCFLFFLAGPSPYLLARDMILITYAAPEQQHLAQSVRKILHEEWGIPQLLLQLRLAPRPVGHDALIHFHLDVMGKMEILAADSYALREAIPVFFPSHNEGKTGGLP